MTTLTRWTLAVLITLLVGSSYLLDGPSEDDAAQAVALDKQDAIEAAQVAWKETLQ